MYNLFVIVHPHAFRDVTSDNSGLFAKICPTIRTSPMSLNKLKVIALTRAARLMELPTPALLPHASTVCI